MTEPYKRAGSPFYWHAYVDPVTNKRVQRSTKQTKLSDARKDIVKHMATLIANGERGVAQEMPLEEALRAYQRQQERRKTADAHNEKARVDRLIGLQEFKKDKDTGELRPVWSMKGWLVSQVTTEAVETLKTERLAENYARNTINHEIKTLARAWKMAAATGAKVAKVPPVFRKFKPERKLRALSLEEFRAVLEHLDPKSPLPGRAQTKYVPRAGSKIAHERQEAYDIFLALVLTGGRWGEIAKLTWDAVDILDWTRIRLWAWKTDKERDVPVADLLRDMLVARRERKKGGVYVFPGTKRPNEPRPGPCRAISRALDRAGCNAPHLVAKYGKATIHSLRHTFATWQRAGGAGLDEVQDLLGHADIATTRIYAHIQPAQVVAKAKGTLDRALGVNSLALVPTTAGESQ